MSPLVPQEAITESRQSDRDSADRAVEVRPGCRAEFLEEETPELTPDSALIQNRQHEHVESSKSFKLFVFL